jgi:hypothetical protein
MTALRIAARPFTSPCATCPGEIPEELNTAVFALADDPAKTVCDTCAKAANLPAYWALNDLRNLDGQYWSIVNRTGQRASAEADAAAYLATLMQGLAELLAMYLSPDQARDTCVRLREIAAAGLDTTGAAA